MLRAIHVGPRLILAPHPSGAPVEAFWFVGGRLVDSGPVPAQAGELHARTLAALTRASRADELGAHVPPDEVDEVRILTSWLASHPTAPQLVLDPPPDRRALMRFAAGAASAASPSAVQPSAAELEAGDARSGNERELDDDRFDRVGADQHV